MFTRQTKHYTLCVHAIYSVHHEMRLMILVFSVQLSPHCTTVNAIFSTDRVKQKSQSNEYLNMHANRKQKSVLEGI